MKGNASTTLKAFRYCSCRINSCISSPPVLSDIGSVVLDANIRLTIAHHGGNEPARGYCHHFYLFRGQHILYGFESLV